MGTQLHNELQQINKDLDDTEFYFTFFKDFEKHPLAANREFNIINAWWMAEFSRLAYVKDRQKIIDELKRVGFHVEFFYNHDTEAHVAWNDDVVVIFYRGTQLAALTDIRSDIVFIHEDSESMGEVHGGFKDALEAVWADIEPFFSEKAGSRLLFITGHSLGAAVATINAARTGGVLYTFGSPRVGTKKFALYMDVKGFHYRFINNFDIVTHLPPIWFGFRHCGNIMTVNDKGKFVESKTSSTLRGLGFEYLASAVYWVCNIINRNIKRTITDHYMRNYSKNIKNLLNT